MWEFTIDLVLLYQTVPKTDPLFKCLWYGKPQDDGQFPKLINVYCIKQSPKSFKCLTRVLEFDYFCYIRYSFYRKVSLYLQQIEGDELRSALFRDFTQGRIVVSYRRLGKTCRSHPLFGVFSALVWAVRVLVSDSGKV